MKLYFGGRHLVISQQLKQVNSACCIVLLRVVLIWFHVFVFLLAHAWVNFGGRQYPGTRSKNNLGTQGQELNFPKITGLQ